jgi:Zn-dependent protease
MSNPNTYFAILLIGAWFIQMGAHEGAHAYVAHRCGDDTAYLMGKRSFNPINHIEWNNLNSIFLSIILPCVTAFSMFPIGMAWVPVNPRRLKKVGRDMALISFAGPMANIVVTLACVLGHTMLAPLGATINSTGVFQGIWLFDRFLFAIGYTSIIYGLFNLVPIPPLDGSKVLRHFLPQDGKDIMDNIAPYGMMLILVLFWVGNASVVFSYPLGLFLELWKSI